MNHEIHHLAAAYALDALDADERRAFEAHYTSCDVCVSEVRDFRAVGEHLAQSAAVQPPPDLKSRIMAEVAQTRQVSPIPNEVVVDLAQRRRLKSVAPLLMAAAAAVVVALIGVSSLRTNISDTELVMGAPDAVVTALDGENGTIRVVWSDQRDQVVVFANGLPAPGEGKVYELWFLQSEGVAPAGLFQTNADGVVRAVLDVDDLQPAGWGVTIEPAGGSDQPTGEVLYAATI